MLNFAVGPVQSDDAVLQIGSEQIPYFRTDEFSDMMLENESAMQRLLHADRQSRTVFLTGSGTAAMEASVMGCLTQRDHALVPRPRNCPWRMAVTGTCPDIRMRIQCLPGAGKR